MERIPKCKTLTNENAVMVSLKRVSYSKCGSKGLCGGGLQYPRDSKWSNTRADKHSLPPKIALHLTKQQIVPNFPT